MIPYGKQEIIQQDIDAVVDVLQSDFLTQGPQVPLFEKSIKGAVNADYAFAVNSATSALQIACLA
jgi:dTDP-4-amino-4,6-dideoxygalactose transaminase